MFLVIAMFLMTARWDQISALSAVSFVTAHLDDVSAAGECRRGGRILALALALARELASVGEADVGHLSGLALLRCLPLSGIFFVLSPASEVDDEEDEADEADSPSGQAPEESGKVEMARIHRAVVWSCRFGAYWNECRGREGGVRGSGEGHDGQGARGWGGRRRTQWRGRLEGQFIMASPPVRRRPLEASRPPKKGGATELMGLGSKVRGD